ncbi:hypothetical protein FRC06_002114 [Ceratobasidium sp. 370]|nr:hypothetical protein FRC06_002114 [Ceratobasidium sp. 370]
MNFYKEAAKMLDIIESKKSSIKGCLSLAAEKDRKRLGALILETLKMKPAILEIIGATPMMHDERRHLHSQSFAVLLVHDLLFTPGGIQMADGPIKQAVYRHRTRLQAELVKLKIRKKVQSNGELAQPDDPRAAIIPRYLRVNRNKWSPQDAANYYASKAYTVGKYPGTPSQNQIIPDKHIPDLFIFNSGYAIHSDDAYNSGKMIAQDKASCFPALVLNPPAQDDTYVIDATAAPGNKGEGMGYRSWKQYFAGRDEQIFAFERNKRRFKTLEQMVQKAGCKNVEPMLDDFLAQDPGDSRFTKVTHILLDPSCSGSGIVNRLDYLTAEVLDFIQVPAVTRIVYSTCSVHVEENEAVVRGVLEDRGMCESGFKLAPRSQVLSHWVRRGLPHDGLSGHIRYFFPLKAKSIVDSDQADALIRCSPGEDVPGTNGFFVACFVRERSCTSQPRNRGSLKRKATSAEFDDQSKRKRGPEAGIV